MRHRAILIFVTVLAVIGLGTAIGVTWAHYQQPVAGHNPPASASVSPGISPAESASPSVASPASPSGTGSPGPTITATSSPSNQPTAPALPAYLQGKDIEVIPTSRPIVALTFDAGANAEGLPSILTTLAAQRVPGTFFLTGDFANHNPTAVRAIVSGGHRLGNHSATHPYFTDLSDAAIRDQLVRAETAIGVAGGSQVRPLFRFPYGDRNTRTIAAVNAAGYGAVRWTVDTLGWKGTSSGITVSTVVNRVLGSARPGEIVLMHIGSHPDDRSTLDADALPTVITQLRIRGYSFVTLDVLL
jgi:peptidoglycan-N-acetylglucosamine deacetylase